MKKKSFILKPMQLNNLKDGMRLSGDEGWNQTEKDWRLLIETPENFGIVAEADNKVIGTITAMNYTNKIAWIGMVLVDKTYRGMGISKLLVTDILGKLKSCRSIKLDATPAGQQVYKKFGFEDEFSITRMINSSMQNFLIDNDKNILPEPIQSKHIKEVAALDEKIFGADRTQLINYLLNEHPHKAWLLKHNGNVTGFVLGRAGNKFHHIGPVLASTIYDAKILISKELQALSNQPVVVDVLNDKEELINSLYSIGFTKQREFIRMYKKENSLAANDKYYLICGPEFG